jgi:subtilisin family serine protease
MCPRPAIFTPSSSISVPRTLIRRGFLTLAKLAALASILSALRSPAQQTPASPLGAIVPHRYLVAFRNGTLPGVAQAYVRTVGTRILRNYSASNIALVQADPESDDNATLAALAAQPNVIIAVHDRIVSAHTITARPALSVTVGTPPAPANPYDTYYTSTPQNWAVVAAGGYGAGILGGPAHGPWDTTQGAGVRIAILDSGVDATHPDIAPNLALNLSEIDQTPSTGLPSPCDTGSPDDQQGHGTWVASLAAAAMGPGTGLTIGVAPAASILNIKVIERLPDPSSTASDIATQCKTGQAGGLLSWVLQGIDDAVANHADVINLSLGTLVDLNTGEGAGLQALFNQATYAATLSGAVVIASAGNDGVELSNPRYIELPAQSRGVLAVVASTNPACVEDLTPGAACAPGPITLPYYSNFGAALNAVAAPGGSYPDGPINGISGWLLGACSSGIANTADGPPANSAHSFGCFNLGHAAYVQAMGTSASAALVSGAAALVRAAHPNWTADQITTALRSAATPVATLPAAPVLNISSLVP